MSIFCQILSTLQIFDTIPPFQELYVMENSFFELDYRNHRAINASAPEKFAYPFLLLVFLQVRQALQAHRRCVALQ